MLILSRKEHQRIVVGSDVIIEIMRIKGEVVSVGISAPRNVPVHREEVLRRIEAKESEETNESLGTDCRTI